MILAVIEGVLLSFTLLMICVIKYKKRPGRRRSLLREGCTGQSGRNGPFD